MPTISRFFGIVIQMHFDEHTPPHFHAIYREFEAAITIHPVGVLAGSLPPRALGMVVEWTRLHAADLLDNWDRARGLRPLVSVDPLD